MTCERYWREGILLAERGDPDPHRDTCTACRREHNARDKLIHALPLTGGSDTGDPAWEARVWNRIARLESRPTRRGWWLGGGLATAVSAALMYWALANREACEPMRTHIAVFPAEIAQRSTSPSIGGRVRIAVKPTDEVRVYCADRLVARCHAGSSKNGCASDARGVVAEVPLTDSGEYRVVVVNTVTAEPVGDLVRDLEAIVAAGGEYQLTELPVH